MAGANHYSIPIDDLQASCVETWAELRRSPASPAPPEVALSSRGRVASRDLRRHLDWLIEQLAGDPERAAELRRQGFDLIFCPWRGDGGPTLWPAQMQGIAERGLDFLVDFTYVAFSRIRPAAPAIDSD